jgi:hypothetical protein
MELFSLLARSLLCCIFPSVDEWRRGWPPFIGGEEGVLGKCLLPSWKAPNRRLGALNLPDTLGTDVGKAASDNMRKMGPR